MMGGGIGHPLNNQNKEKYNKFLVHIWTIWMKWDWIQRIWVMSLNYLAPIQILNHRSSWVFELVIQDLNWRREVLRR